jgi:hypothetical protein
VHSQTPCIPHGLLQCLWQLQLLSEWQVMHVALTFSSTPHDTCPQNEERTLWQAPDVYMRMSPFMVSRSWSVWYTVSLGTHQSNSGQLPQHPLMPRLLTRSSAHCC